MERKQQLLIGAGVTVVALIGYAIYADLSRLFPNKDSEKNKK